jgi:hypothetical protein
VGWTAAEIEKLRAVVSEVYCTRDRALAFIRDVGFPRYPDFKDNDTFWREVFYEGANGAIPDYCHHILDVFELGYRHNPVAKDLRESHYACGPADPSPHPPDAADSTRVGRSAREMFRADLGAAAAAASCELALTRWTAAELTALRDRLEAWRFRSASRDVLVGRAIDVLQVLCDSLEVEPVLSALGVWNVKINYLKHIYWRTVGRIPAGNTLESMVIDAAAVAITEDRTGEDVQLTALARFVLGIAGHCGAEPRHPVLLSWLRSQHHHLADAQEYLASRSRPSWLLIDCGDEPRRQAERPPPRPSRQSVRVSGVLHTAGGTRLLEHEAPDGLESALRGLLDQAGPEQHLVVDLAVPHALMGAGLEHLPVVETTSGYQPLSASCHPRLRWSLRLHHATRRERPDRLAPTRTWSRIPRVLQDEVVADREALQRWLGDKRNQDLPYLVGGPAAGTDFDPVLMMLRSGRAFIIWFARGTDPAAAQRIAKVARRLPPASRRICLPEQIDGADRTKMTIIWDDPEGREGFALPSHLPGFDG